MKSKVRKIKYKLYHNEIYITTEIIVTHANIKVVIRDQNNKIIKPIFQKTNDSDNIKLSD